MSVKQLSTKNFFFNDTATNEIYTLSLHDALPISRPSPTSACCSPRPSASRWAPASRSEEHTSELQSRSDLVCRLLLEQKKKIQGAPSTGAPDRPSDLDVKNGT